MWKILLGVAGGIVLASVLLFTGCLFLGAAVVEEAGRQQDAALQRAVQENRERAARTRARSAGVGKIGLPPPARAAPVRNLACLNGRVVQRLENGWGMPSGFPVGVPKRCVVNPES